MNERLPRFGIGMMICFLIAFSIFGLMAAQVSIAVEPPQNPVNELGKIWEKKVVSTASGMIHIQWRYETKNTSYTYRIYKGEGEENPFSTEEIVRESIPWCTDVSGEKCFFRYLPEDEEEGLRYWFLVRAVNEEGQESGNLDAESVVIDLPWLNGLEDPNSLNFYVDDEKRSDSFLQESQGCLFCSESSKIYFRLVCAKLAARAENAWYYIDPAFDPPLDLETLVHDFETRIYPTNLAYFGRPESSNEWTDIDHNGHIIILFTELGSNVAGYFNTIDKFPGYYDESYVGNSADMFYISPSAPLNSIKGVLAHELQHMQHFEANLQYFDPDNNENAWEELWLDEACSGFAEEVNNLLSGSGANLYWYRNRPHEISLTRFGFFDVHERFGGCPIHWDESQENFLALSRVLAHYDMVGLWAHYMEYNASPVTSLASLVEDPSTGLVSVQNHLAPDFKQVFIDWSIANYVNPYTEPGNTKYHYTPQFSGGAALFEISMVNPGKIPTAELLKTPDLPEPESPELSESNGWQERSLYDLTTDYLLLDYDGQPGYYIHWEVKDLNDEDNVCHLAVLDQTTPSQAFLQNVLTFPITNLAGSLALSEGEKDLSTCLIVTNIAQYKEKDYLSTYRCRAYLTKNPMLLQVKIIQNQNEFILGDTPVNIVAGLVQVHLQFDQSMSQTDPPCLYLDPQGEGAGRETINIQPAEIDWIHTLYPNDTWAGSLIIPENEGQNWNGLANMTLSKAGNAWQEPLADVQVFSFFIDTQKPGRITDPSLCFIDSLVYIKWDEETALDLLGYRLYGIPNENEFCWIPLEGLNDPHFPSILLPDLEPGTYPLILTALDKAGNESVPSEKFGLAMQIELPFFSGLNIINYFIRPPFEYNSEDLLSALGSFAQSVSIYEAGTDRYLTTYWHDQIIKGPVFPLLQDKAYLIYQKETDSLMFTGQIGEQELTLEPGKNLIGLPLLSAYESLEDVLTDLTEKGETVASIHYYQPKDGKWTGSYKFFDKIPASNTTLKKGLGCLVYKE